MLKAWVYETYKESKGSMVEVNSFDDLFLLFQDKRFMYEEPRELIIGYPTEAWYAENGIRNRVDLYIEIFNGYRG